MRSSHVQHALHTPLGDRVSKGRMKIAQKGCFSRRDKCLTTDHFLRFFPHVLSSGCAVLCRTAAIEVRSSNALHLTCAACQTRPPLLPLPASPRHSPNCLTDILSTLTAPGTELQEGSSAASHIGFQSLPRQHLDGFTSHPAMADASIHLAAVPAGSDNQPTRVPVGMGSALAAPGLPPASCWSIARTTSGSSARQGLSDAPHESNMYMLPTEPNSVMPYSSSWTGTQAAFAIAALTTKPMARVQQGLLSREAPSQTLDKDISFRVEWQTHVPAHALHLSGTGQRYAPDLRRRPLLPMWQQGHMSSAVKHHSSCSSSRTLCKGNQLPGDATGTCLSHRHKVPMSASAACALQLQAVQTCMRHSRAQSTPGPDQTVVLRAPMSTSMQQQSLCRYTTDAARHISSAAAMALIRVAAVETGSMQGWQANFYSSSLPGARFQHLQASLPGDGHASQKVGDAFGRTSDAGATLQPRLLPMHGPSNLTASAAAFSAASVAAAGWLHATQGRTSLDRVVISGGMGALGALVATWIFSLDSASRPLLLGRSGRFPSESAASFMKVGLPPHAGAESPFLGVVHGHFNPRQCQGMFTTHLLLQEAWSASVHTAAFRATGQSRMKPWCTCSDSLQKMPSQPIGWV